MGSFDTRQQQSKPWVETPLIESAPLSRAAGCRIFLKLENHQPSGSFKSRAIGNLILSHVSNPKNIGKRLHFFIPSGGNAGLAAVTAARSLGYPCTVCVPQNTKAIMLQKLEDCGARVVPHGPTIETAAQHMRDVLIPELKAEGAGKGEEVVGIELHPFDHERIWEGNSTIVDELAYQLPAAEVGDTCASKALPMDAIVCSVGGGGLMNGIIQGIERQSHMMPSGQQRRPPSPPHANGDVMNGGVIEDENIHVIATETYGAHSLGLAMKEKSLIKMPAITSQASSLGAVRVAERTLDYALHPPTGVQVHSSVLHDSEAAKGVLRFADEQKLLVELACGVSVQVALAEADVDALRDPSSVTGSKKGKLETGLQTTLSRLVPGFNSKTRVVIVVCGGSNVTLDMAREWKERIDKGWSMECAAEA